MHINVLVYFCSPNTPLCETESHRLYIALTSLPVDGATRNICVVVLTEIARVRSRTSSCVSERLAPGRGHGRRARESPRETLSVDTLYNKNAVRLQKERKSPAIKNEPIKRGFRAAVRRKPTVSKGLDCYRLCRVGSSSGTEANTHTAKNASAVSLSLKKVSPLQ